MAKISYAEIRRLQKQFGREDMSSADFAQRMNEVTQTKDYDAGLGNGLGKAIKGGSYAVDQVLERLGLTRIAGGAGEAVFGQAGRAPFEAIPRMIVDTLPFLAGGVGGVLAGSTLIGANTYEKTDSPGAALVSGGLSALLPFAGRAGGAAATNVAGRLGVNLGKTEALAYGMSEGAKGILRGATAETAARAGTAQMLAQATLKSPLARMANYAGEQAGFLAGGLATQALTNATAAEKGQGWEAAKATFTLPNIVAAAIGQTPMAIHPILPPALPHWGRVWRDNAQLKFARDYAETLHRYDKEVFAPRRDVQWQTEARQSLREEVERRLAQQPRGLPAPGESTVSARVNPDVSFGRGPRNRFILQSDGKAEPKPIQLTFDDGLLKVTSELPSDVVNKVTQGNPWTSMLPAERRAALASDDPQVSLAASMLQSKTAPAEVQKLIAEKRAQGVPMEDVAREAQAALLKKASASLSREEQAQAKRAERAAQKQERDQATMTALAEWEKTATPEERQALASVAKTMDADTQVEGTTALARAVLKWANGTATRPAKAGGVEGLTKYLQTTARYMRKQSVDKTQRTVISTHATKAEASLRAEELRFEDPSRAYQRDGKKVVSFPWAEPKDVSTMGDAKETFAGEQRATEVMDEVHQTEARLTAETTRPEEAAVTSVYRDLTDTSAEQFVARLDHETVERFGGDVADVNEGWARGQDRLLIAMDTLARVKGSANQLRELLNTGLWASAPELKQWIAEAAPYLKEYVQGVKTVTGQGAKLGPVVETLKNKQQLDADYMTAVQRGDMEAVQKLVDDAARAAGYNVGPVWHGSQSKTAFNQFDPSKKGQTDEGNLGSGYYFSPTKDGARGYGAGWGDMAKEGVWEKSKGGLLGAFYLRIENPHRTESKAYGKGKIPEGKDGVILMNNGKPIEFLAASPDQIKSADPVTRDADGNVIPLSQRFDIKSDDIRYLGPAVESPAQPTFIGTRETLGELLQLVGLHDHVDDVAKLVSLWDNAEVAWAHLTQAKDGQTQLPLGMFTTDGPRGNAEKMVWLSQVNEPIARKLFALTHELNGHALWKWAEEGKLDAVSVKQLRDFRDMVGSNSPEQNRVMLRELWDTLPDKFKKDEGLRKLVEQTAGDPDEVLANINSMVSLAMVHAEPRRWDAFLSTMPKPIADSIALIARWGRKVYEAISGLMFARGKGWVEGGLDKEAQAGLHSYIDTLYKVLKYDEVRAEHVRQALKLDMSTDTPLKFAEALSSGQMFNEAGSAAGQEIQKYFGFGRATTKEPKTAQGKFAAGIDYALSRLEALAVKYPQLRRVVTTSARREAATAKMEARILKELGLGHKGLSYRAEKTHPVYVIENDLRLSAVRNQLVGLTQKNQKTLYELIVEGNPDVQAQLNKLSTSERQIMREAFVAHESAQKVAVETIRQSNYETLVYQAGRIMMETDVSKTMSPAQAEAVASETVKAVMEGRLSDVPPAGASIMPFVVEMSGIIEKQVKSFASRPEFISMRRFGKYSARVEYKDGRPYEALNFDTPAERRAYEDSIASEIRAGNVVVSDLHRPGKPFSVTENALDFLLNEERGRADHLVRLMEMQGVATDKAREIAGQNSLASELTRELAARQLPNLSPHRKLVAGYENLDTLRQQVEYTQMLVRALSKRTANAEFEMRMLDPQVSQLDPLVGRQIRETWENYKTPDSSITRGIQQANYLRYLALNFTNMLQDATQAITGALPAALINDGAKVGQTFRRIMSAMRDVRIEKNLTAEEKTMLEKYRAGNRGLASYTDAASNDYLRLVNDNRAAQGLAPYTMRELVQNKTHGAMLFFKNIHKPFTDFGMESAMLSAFRHFKAKGLSGKDAEQSAFDMATSAMGAMGRGGRQAGLAKFGGPVAAIMTAMQSYAFNQLFTWKNLFERSIGSVKGLTATERKNAWKAVGVHTSLMFAQAGILGLPLVASVMTLLDKMFGINSREAVAGWLHDTLPDDENHVIQQLALHGAVNAFGGVDYAARAQNPGVLGLNAYDGFSPDALVGPTWSIMQDIMGGVASAAQGEPGKALDGLMPNTLKRTVQAYRDDWEFRRKDGSLIDESTPWEQSVYAVMGIKPVRVATQQERDQWQRLDAEIEQKERSQWTDEMARLLMEGDTTTIQQAVADRLAQRPNEEPNAVANAIVNRVLEREKPRDASRQPGASGRLNEVMGLPATVLTESQRLVMQQELLQRLGMGLPATAGMHQRAQAVDAVRMQAPWLAYEEALQAVGMQTGQTQRRSLRGLHYGFGG